MFFFLLGWVTGLICPAGFMEDSRWKVPESEHCQVTKLARERMSSMSWEIWGETITFTDTLRVLGVFFLGGDDAVKGYIVNFTSVALLSDVASSSVAWPQCGTCNVWIFKNPRWPGVRMNQPTGNWWTFTRCKNGSWTTFQLGINGSYSQMLFE